MPDSKIEISVILATHNRRPLLRRCLEALGKQTLDPDRFEVIVADAGSSDGSAEMVAALETAYPLRLLDHGKLGHAVTQNRALEVATAPIGILIDDDIVPGPELLAETLAPHRRAPRIVGVGSLSQQPVAANDWYAHAYAKGWNEHLGDLARR